MSYQLSRLRLVSVGDRAARFADLTLDMSSADNADEAADSIVWLRNGGGKSSLLSLFFALLLPLRKDFMGKSVKRYLEDYVSTGDTSHTVAEWVAQSEGSLLPPARLVTGAVYEWADRRKPLDPDRDRDKLKCWYYTFFAVPGVLSLDRLPVHDDTGRLRPAADFIRSLHEVAAERPQQFSFAITEHRNQWMQTLTTRNLDPALFGYQKQMNHSEGGVAELFNFPSADKFIDFLIDLTVDATQPELVATNLRNIVELLGRKPELLVDLDFCVELSGRLDTLATRHEESIDARAKASDARMNAARLAGAFNSMARHQRASEQQWIDKANDFRDVAQRLDADRKRINDTANELLRIAAVRRQTAALAARDEKKPIAADAKLDAEAWAAVEPLADRTEALRQAGLVRQQIAQEELDAAPLRAKRDSAAAALRIRYRSLAEVEETSRKQQSTSADNAFRSAELEDAQAQQDRDRAVLAGSRADQVREQVATVHGDLDDAVASGDLPDRETDPEVHLHELRTRRAIAGVEIDKVRARREMRPALRATKEALRRTLQAEIGTQKNERDRLACDRSELTSRVDALATHARLAELVQLQDGGRLDLWSEESDLRAVLEHAVSSAESAIVDTRVDAAEDDRGLDGLNADAFLPTTRDAQRVVDLIAASGITARPGWDLLRDLVAAPERHRVLQSTVVAQLATGVVVAHDDFELARGVVESSGLHSVAHVSLCTAAHLERALTTVLPEWHTVRNDPALFDPVAAQKARAELGLRRQQQDHRIELLHRQANEDRELRRALDKLLQDCPAGHLTALELNIEQYQQSIAKLEEDDDQAEQAIGELDRQEAEDAESEKTLSEDRSQLAERVERLAGLVAQASKLPQLRRDIEQLDADAVRFTTLAVEHADRAKAYRRAEREARDDAVEHKSNRDRYEHAMRAISLLDANGVEPDVDESTPLSVLQAEFETLESQWRTVATESVLAERLSGLRDRSERAERTLMSFSEETRERAEELLATPEGQDPDRRAAARVRAVASSEAAQRQLNTADFELKQADAEVASRTPRDRPRYVQLEDEPRTEAEAIERATALAAKATEMSAQVTAMTKDVEEAETAAGKAFTAAQLFGQRASRLTDAVNPEDVPIEAPAYDGDDEQADADVEVALKRLNAALEDAAQAKQRVDGVIQAVRKVSAESRFAGIPDAIRDRFTGDDAELLSERAAARAAELRVRRTTIEGQLADIGRDQRLVVIEIAALVQEVLANLDSAHRHSRLPGTLGAWADQHFLRIKFVRPAAEQDLHARIDAVVDRFVAEGTKPDGLGLLKRCVHEAVGPRGFTVKVLKPNSDLAVEPVDVTHLGKFSGGEKLTVCVALFCTLARLRAINRGRAQTALGGTLVLDNPLGTASHVALLRLQRDVAAAHGVQLVYTTGVEDLGAVGQFPNVLRLRNAPGVLRTRRYVVLDDGPAPASDGITGVRVTQDESVSGPPL